MFHGAAAASPILTLAVWWSTIALDRIRLGGVFTARNIRVAGAVACAILWAVAIIQMILEPIVENVSNVWASVVSMLVVVIGAVFCIWVGLKFASRLRASKIFSKTAHVDPTDAAVKRIETILARTSVVLLIVLITLCIFVPVAIISTANVVTAMFATFVYITMSIVQMIAVTTAVFTFPRSYSSSGSSNSSSRNFTTSSGNQSTQSSAVLSNES